MWRREVSQAVRGRPKRNSVRTIRPKSANRINLIRSRMAFCDFANANKKKTIRNILQFTTHIQRCVSIIVVYPCNMKRDEKRSSNCRASEQERVDHTEKLKRESRRGKGTRKAASCFP